MPAKKADETNRGEAARIEGMNSKMAIRGIKGIVASHCDFCGDHFPLRAAPAIRKAIQKMNRPSALNSAQNWPVPSTIPASLWRE